MTPKEKAKELFDKAIYKIQMADKYGYLLKDDKLYLAKLIAADTTEQIFEFMKMDDIHNEDCHMANTHWPQYWMEVKKEIERL